VTSLGRPQTGSELPTVTSLITPLIEVDDRGVYFEESFSSWRDHIQRAAAVAAALRVRMNPDKPPHVGVLL
jgi:fatty-acyl-CoA synthase